MDVHAGKYKLSSNSPIIILKNSTPWAALGTPGGHTIPQNISQVVMNLIDLKMGMQDAIDASKVAFLEEENMVKLESGIKTSVISSLKEKGHTITYGDIGNAMGAKIFTNTNSVSFDVGVDKRRDGWSQVNISQKIWESTSAVD
ncbi:MAG: gamma-glutamyltransferase [Chlamydiota bacterium]|jgi:gamma-glutamyltranspeptidase/glutathione hydrolase